MIWDDSRPPGLSTGKTTFYFGVDMIMNGAFNEAQTHLDSVEVRVTP